MGKHSCRFTKPKYIVLRLHIYFLLFLCVRGVWFGQVNTHKQPVSHWPLPRTLHPWCRRYTLLYTCICTYRRAHRNNEEKSVAMSPAEHYFKRNVGNAAASKYGAAFLMTGLRLRLLMAWKQLSKPSPVSSRRQKIHIPIIWHSSWFGFKAQLPPWSLSLWDLSGLCIKSSCVGRNLFVLWTCWYYCYESTCVECFSFFESTEKIERTVQIEASTVEIEERGVKLRLTVVDTPGYGDAINSQDWCVYM